MRKGIIKSIQWEEQLGIVYLRVRTDQKRPWDICSVPLTLDQFRQVYEGVARVDHAYDRHTDEMKQNVMRNLRIAWSKNSIRIGRNA